MNAMNQAWNLLKALRREPEPEPEPEEEEFDPSSFNYAEALSQLLASRREQEPTSDPHEKGRRGRAFDAAMDKLREQSQMALDHKNQLRTDEFTARTAAKNAEQDSARAQAEAEEDAARAREEHGAAMPSLSDDQELWDEWRKIDPRNEGMEEEEEDEPASEPAVRPRRQSRPARGNRGRSKPLGE